MDITTVLKDITGEVARTSRTLLGITEGDLTLIIVVIAEVTAQGQAGTIIGTQEVTRDKVKYLPHNNLVQKLHFPGQGTLLQIKVLFRD